MKITNKSFFTVPPLMLAENLLGKIIVRRLDDGQMIKCRINEVEAYGGNDDSASHAYKGITKRTAPMFEDGGILYVYLCYGIFDLLNIVSGKKGEAGAVLIRGVDDIKGKVSGPGRTARTLQITRALNNEDLVLSAKIWLEDDGFVVGKKQIKRLTRVGIKYALQKDQDKLWRFKIG